MMPDITPCDDTLAPWLWLIGFALSAESRETNGGRNWSEVGSLPNTSEPEFSHLSSFTDSHSNRCWFVIVVVKSSPGCWLTGREEEKVRPDLVEAGFLLSSSPLFCVKGRQNPTEALRDMGQMWTETFFPMSSHVHLKEMQSSTPLSAPHYDNCICGSSVLITWHRCRSDYPAAHSDSSVGAGSRASRLPTTVRALTRDVQ